MDIIALLQGLATQIATLQAQLVDTQAAADSIAKENYDKGFADGVASVPPTTGGPSQADLDAANAKIVELQGSVDSLNASVLAMQAQVADLQAQLAAKDQELADFKAKVLADVKVVEADLA